MNDASDLVIAATFTLLAEAEVAASLLDGEGIESLIEKPFASGVRPDWLFGGRKAANGVRLLVRRDDVATAREILSAIPEDPGDLE